MAGVLEGAVKIIQNSISLWEDLINPYIVKLYNSQYRYYRYAVVTGQFDYNFR